MFQQQWQCYDNVCIYITITIKLLNERVHSRYCVHSISFLDWFVWRVFVLPKKSEPKYNEKLVGFHWSFFLSPVLSFLSVVFSSSFFFVLSLNLNVISCFFFLFICVSCVCVCVFGIIRNWKWIDSRLYGFYNAISFLHSQAISS